MPRTKPKVHTRPKPAPKSKTPSEFLIGGNALVDGKGNKLTLPKAPTPKKPPEPATLKHGTYPAALLGNCARVIYNSFLRESGYDKHAAVPTYDELKTFHQARWETIARDVLDCEARFKDHHP